MYTWVILSLTPKTNGIVLCLGKNMLRSASSPVARDHFWGIFELIIQESGDKESDGKGRKKINPRSGRRSTLIPITPLPLFSLASSSHVFLRKPMEEAVLILGRLFLSMELLNRIPIFYPRFHSVCIFFFFFFFLTKQSIIPSLKNSVGLSSVSKSIGRYKPKLKYKK